MGQTEPDGYQEIGEGLAQPVAEGLRGLFWAVDLAKLLGYTAADVKAWVAHYRDLHAKDLDRSEKNRLRKSRKIKRWQRRADALKKLEPGA
jgi:hypothetical protein